MLFLSRIAVEIVVDKSYMKVHRLWYSNVAQSAPCTVWQVETNVVVPVLEVLDFEDFRTNILAKDQQYLDAKVALGQKHLFTTSLDFTVPKVCRKLSTIRVDVHGVLR